MFTRLMGLCLSLCLLCMPCLAQVLVDDLRCEFLSNPAGIDEPSPRLSWKLESEARGARQSSYQIRAASSRRLLVTGKPDLWDSGKVPSRSSLLVGYGGRTPGYGQEVWWQVRVWDGRDAASGWSPAAFWSRGPSPSDWKAKWICAAGSGGLAEDLSSLEWVWRAEAGADAPAESISLSKSITIPSGSTVSAAVFTLSADNSFELFVNGASVGSGIDWNIAYRIDIASKLKPGSNRLEIKATNSAVSPAGVIGLLRIALSDGKSLIVPVDETWRLPDGSSPVAVKAFGQQPWGQAPSSATSGGRMPVFRREFAVKRNVTRATVYVCGLGHYELRLNGSKVGSREIDPGWTNYRKTCLYSAYDVTGALKPGSNAFGVLLGNGMYNVPGERYTKFTGSFGPPKLILQLLIRYSDGTSETIVTDQAWRTAPGPITVSSEYGGEDYDATLEEPGWDLPGFNVPWKPAEVCLGPGGVLRAQTMEPVVVRKTLQPISWKQAGSSWVADFGQNMSGWPSVTVRGVRGAAIRLTPGEMLSGDRPDQGQSGGPMYWQYTCRGGATEQWRPRFSYYGFRWLQVDGAAPAGRVLPGQAEITGIKAEVLYPDVREAGSFTCSDPLVNRIHDLIKWAIVSNMKSVLTDCPHREKLGWLEESHLCGPSIMYNYDVSALYSKIATDMREAQLPNGLVPDIAPEYTVFGGGFRDSPEWGSAYIIAPWQHYLFTGDKRTLAVHYNGMRRYISYLTRMGKGGILTHGLGDWADVSPGTPVSSNTPMGVTATATFLQDLQIMSEMAGLLGRATDADGFTRQAEGVRDAFNRRFFDAASRQYATGSQVSNGMALFVGAPQPDAVGDVAANLVSDVVKRDYHTTAGDVGHRYVLQALAEAGRSDVVLKMMQQTTYPSYGHQLVLGATTLTEAWDGPVRGWSQNHFMLGHAEEWFYRWVLGIDQAPGSSSFEQILIHPETGCGLEWARGHFDSPRGRIKVGWRKDQGRTTIDVTIPANATALLRIPATGQSGVTESGKAAASAPGVRFAGQEPGALLYEIGSGSYSFSIATTGTSP